MSKIYVHIDGDAFFVACEVARRPELAGLPVIVGEERGIVTALSYEAKALGIKRGDPIYKIKKEYKNVTIIQSHFDLYESYSRITYSILSEYSDEVENYSVDECFMSFESEHLKSKDLREFFQNIKSRIKNETGVTYSFGVSNTKVRAKLASKHMKPNGLCILMNDSEIMDIYKNKDVGDVWGIGRRMKIRLNSIGINNVYDFVNCDPKKIDKLCGKNVTYLWSELRGVSRLPIVKESKTLKSLQATRSFMNITSDKNFVFAELTRNLEQAASRLVRHDLYSNSFVIFIKTHTKGERYGKYMSIFVELPEYTRDVLLIIKYASEAFDKIYSDKYKYKKTGVTLLNLKQKENIETSLFADIFNASCDKNAHKSAAVSGINERNNNIHIGVNKEVSQSNQDIIQSLKDKYGSSIIYVASSNASRKRRASEVSARNKNDNYLYDLPLPYMGIVI